MVGQTDELVVFIPRREWFSVRVRLYKQQPDKR